MNKNSTLTAVISINSYTYLYVYFGNFIFLIILGQSTNLFHTNALLYPHYPYRAHFLSLSTSLSLPLSLPPSLHPSISVCSVLFYTHYPPTASLNTAVICYIFIGASRNLHNSMLSSVLRAPISFFDENPVGELRNRCYRCITPAILLNYIITNNYYTCIIVTSY